MRKISSFCKVLLILCFSSISLFSSAQVYLKQVIAASGGDFMNPANKVKLYSYNPAKKAVTIFDSIPGRFTRDVVIDNGMAYVSADSMLYKYNLDNLKRTDSLVINGINRMAIHNNFLIISKWYPSTSNYIEIYNKNNFSLLYRDTKVNAYSKGIVVLRDTAYVAVSAFDSGKVAVISLSNATPAFVKEINLDTTARGMEDIFTDSKNLYTLSYPYGAAYNALTTYNLSTGAIKHNVMPKAMDGVALFDNMLFANLGNGLQPFNTTTQSLETAITNMNYYRGSYDTLNSDFYLIDYNFSSNNKIFIMGRTGTAIDTFEVGMSTEAIAFDYRITTSVAEKIAANKDFSVYPNPAKSVINIVSANSGRSVISLKDITGRTILERSTNLNAGYVETINIENLPKGMYLLQLNTGTETSVKKIIIE